jgi:hypothetical protein
MADKHGLGEFRRGAIDRSVGPVIQGADADSKYRQVQDMTAVIERLRESKVEYVLNQESYGREVGREWAEIHASYEDLEQIPVDITHSLHV